MDWNLICTILQDVSQQIENDPETSIKFPRVEAANDAKINSAITHCHELGFLEVGFADGGPIRIRRMTAQGHVALEDCLQKLAAESARVPSRIGFTRP